MFPLSLILLQEARLRDFQLMLLHLACRCSLRITVIIIIITIFIIIIIIIISINIIRFINIMYIFLNLSKYRAQWLHNIFSFIKWHFLYILISLQTLSVQFWTNASRSGILIDDISSLKDEEVLALCSDDTFHVQFVE